MGRNAFFCVALSIFSTLAGFSPAFAQLQPELFYEHTVTPEESFSLFNKIWGQELDLSERRPVVDLTDTVFEQKYGKVPGTKLYANLSHRGRFWIARIPIEGVKNSYFNLSYFMPVAAHSYIRFQMNEKNPVELIATMPTELPEKGYFDVQDLPEPLETSVKLKDIAMSAEAQWTKNDPKAEYNLFRGVKGNFIQIVRIISLDDRVRDFFRNGNTVRQWKMNLSPRESSSVLRQALVNSETDGTRKFYNTLFYNCTTMAIDTIAEGANPFDREGQPWIKRAFFATNRRTAQVSRTIPVVTGWWGLRVRGLVSKDSEIERMELDPSLAEARAEALQRLLREKGPQAIGETAKPKKQAYINEVISTLGLGPACQAVWH